MERGDIEKGFTESDHIVEGEMRIGGQNHFYLETNASLVIPKLEDGEMEIWSSTQNLAESQVVLIGGMFCTDDGHDDDDDDDE